MYANDTEDAVEWWNQRAELMSRLEAAAKLCDRIAGNVQDFSSEYRRGAGACAAVIRDLKREPLS